MPPLSVLIKPASGSCNMNCDYCFYCDETSKRSQALYGFMSEETLKNVIRKTISHAEGSITYAFQGGEPSLRGIEFFKLAVKFQKQYNRNNITVMNSFQTNGILIDENWCRFFKENSFLVGVSLDGIDDVHDAYRHTRDGDVTFSRILSSIRLLEKHKVDFNILTVISERAAQNVEKIYNFYSQQGWIYQQYIVCLDPLGSQHDKASLSPTSEQYGDFLIRLFRLWYRDWEKGMQPYIRQFENYIAILLGHIPEACDQCGVCSIQTVVEADGSVYPCDFYMLDEYKIGNLNTQRLSDFNHHCLTSDFVKRSLKLSEACKLCRYFYICKGGCQRNRDFIENNGLYENHFCKSYQMFFDCCLDQMKNVAKTIAAKR